MGDIMGLLNLWSNSIYSLAS